MNVVATTTCSYIKKKQCRLISEKPALDNKFTSYCYTRVEFIFTHFLFLVALASVSVEKKLIFTPSRLYSAPTELVLEQIGLHAMISSGLMNLRHSSYKIPHGGPSLFPNDLSAVYSINPY